MEEYYILKLLLKKYPGPLQKRLLRAVKQINQYKMTRMGYSPTYKSWTPELEDYSEASIVMGSLPAQYKDLIRDLHEYSNFDEADASPNDSGKCI